MNLLVSSQNGARVPPVWASVSLLGALAIVFLSVLVGPGKAVHPIWPVTALVFALIGIGAFFSKRQPQ
jgi:hypothetical protein